MIYCSNKTKYLNGNNVDNHQNGYIDYSLGELNLFENTTGYLVMGTIDGKSYNKTLKTRLSISIVRFLYLIV